jgi:hypothetical protein
MQHAGLALDLPPDLVADQAMFSLRAPPPTTGDPRVLHKQTTIRTSLIVHRKEVGDASLEVLTGEVTAELVSTVGGLSDLVTEAFLYQDGAPGFLVGFDFAMPEVGTARQFHALRKDAGVLTTLTLTLDKLRLTDEAKAHWLKVLASATPTGNGVL